MDSRDREYMAGFNLGYELEKTLRDKSSQKDDKKQLELIEKVISKVQGKSDRIEGIKEGRKAFILERQMQQLKEQKKQRDQGMER